MIDDILTMHLTRRAEGNPGRCRSCGAPMLWVKTAKGNAMPLDPDPVDDGEIFFLVDGLARTMGKRDKTVAYTGPKYRNHFLTCPTAEQHRVERK